jgi:hypothetical protein
MSPDTTTPDDPLGANLTTSGWTLSRAEHPAREFDPQARLWNSPGGKMMLAAHGIRDGLALISLYAPHKPDDAHDPLWQINGGPVPLQAALAMAAAALQPPLPGGHTAGFAAAGWTLDPEHILATAVPGLQAWIGPTSAAEPAGTWSAFLFPMPTPELSTWTVKGAHAGRECSLLATANTPAHVITAATAQAAP